MLYSICNSASMSRIYIFTCQQCFKLTSIWGWIKIIITHFHAENCLLRTVNIKLWQIQPSAEMLEWPLSAVAWFFFAGRMADASSESSFLGNFQIPTYIIVPESEKTESEAPQCPVLVFVNSKSGGQLGGDLLVTYRSLLNEHQVLLFA